MGDAQAWLGSQPETIRERMVAGAAVWALRQLSRIGLRSCVIQITIRGREVEACIRDASTGHATVPQLPEGVE
jgi:hypothetical protein